LGVCFSKPITFNSKIIPLQLFSITPIRYIYPLLVSDYIYSPTSLNLSEHWCLILHSDIDII